MSEAIDKVVFLDRGNDTNCTVHLHGATITSWRVKNQEQLFVSKLSVYEGRTPIRGGISIVFPHFGSWKIGPKDGFTHQITWRVEDEPQPTSTGDITASFCVSESDYTCSLWDSPFKITLLVMLSEKELELHFSVQNTSEDRVLPFNIFLLNYFKFSDVTNAQIVGFGGKNFLNRNQDDPTVEEQTEEKLEIKEKTDRLYQEAEEELYITSTFSGELGLVRRNLPDALVWNPWMDGTEKITDLGDEDYMKMLCIGVGHATSRVMLPPLESFECDLYLRAELPKPQAKVGPVNMEELFK